jgi:hypothetical protein
MMRFIDFLPVHMLWISDVHQNVLNEQQGMELVKIGEKSKSRGPCLTLMNDKEAIACGGLMLMWPGTAEIWVRLSLGKCGPAAARELKKQTYRWIEEHHLNRLQATAPAEWVQDCKFIEWLGMKAESTMKKYGPNGVDQIRFAWVRP